MFFKYRNILIAFIIIYKNIRKKIVNDVFFDKCNNHNFIFENTNNIMRFNIYKIYRIYVRIYNII